MGYMEEIGITLIFCLITLLISLIMISSPQLYKPIIILLGISIVIAYREYYRGY